jgi:uncharacterized protein (DUF608 family)
MKKKRTDSGSDRRGFLKTIAGAGMAASVDLPAHPAAQLQTPQAPAAASLIAYPRLFSGNKLKMIAFPLGGVAAGSLALGGRGQLRDWVIFNRPDKGHSPPYAFPSIWVQPEGRKPVARVLESRILPPYEGQDGLGANNVPGLPRLAEAVFTGEFPLAHIDLSDPELPVKVSLDAFSPFIPHDEDASGLPVAFLRYTITNPSRRDVSASVAFSIENPVEPGHGPQGIVSLHGQEPRTNEFRKTEAVQGLFMTNPQLANDHPMHGSFVLALCDTAGGRISYWRGWPKSPWWNSPMLFWDQFSREGTLANEPADRKPIGALCLQRRIEPGASAHYTFLLAWHFPNRTPKWCGWDAPAGYENTIIGNHYSTRFKDAWDAAEFAARNLPSLESRTRRFASILRDSTLPGEVKDAASANLSTLVSTTCFRTADGEFHGFEGSNDHLGCCFGNCTHVWNYETVTPYLFPAFARSLRSAAFGYSMDAQGAIHFRQMLPDGKQRWGFAAADGQMGQIVHAYLDWILSGDLDWLRGIWPRVKKALEFAWVPGGWDANRDGVLEGAQHNTYDVEFYGPNPQCGIYYLAALRAAERMARAVGDSSAAEYARLSEQGSRWIDANLFNGEFYIQDVRGLPANRIAPVTRGDMGAQDTEHPEYQVGKGCLVDQLVGQYMAEVAALGPLLNPKHMRTALASVYRYNRKPSLIDHDCVERTFALNNESAVVVCDYGNTQRPHIPFPYYAEVFTGLEYSTATHMLYAGMLQEGLACIAGTRARYDGEKRNPWDEAECGHHYVRAMSAWTGILALSGFRYDGPDQAVTVTPLIHTRHFRCFWSNATGWGDFSVATAVNATRVHVEVAEGKLPCSTLEAQGPGISTSVSLNGNTIAHSASRHADRTVIRFDSPIVIEKNGVLQIEIRSA